jgi:hypothetical protein
MSPSLVYMAGFEPACVIITPAPKAGGIDLATLHVVIFVLIVRLELTISSVLERCINQFCYINILRAVCQIRTDVSFRSWLQVRCNRPLCEDGLFWQAYKDLNLKLWFWRPLWYHFTIDLFLCPRRESNPHLHELKARCYDQYTRTKAFRFVPPIGFEPTQPKHLFYRQAQLSYVGASA